MRLGIAPMLLSLRYHPSIFHVISEEGHSLTAGQQVLVSHAQTIAARYRGRNGPRYLKAAQTLRQPYWDWAADPNLPVAVTRPQLNITTPYGLLTVRNPLYSYRWQRKENGTGFENTSLSSYAETVRCPLLNGADDDFDIANSNLEAPSLGLASQTVRITLLSSPS